MEIVGYKLIKIEDQSVVEQWGGVWGQCPSIPDPIVLPGYGISYGMSINQELGGYKFIAWEMDKPDPTIQDVIDERSRRLALGFDYDFGSSGTPSVQHVGTTEEDMQGWSEVTTWANSQIALNNTTSTVTILTDTGKATVNAVQWMEVVDAASAFRQPIWRDSFEIQSMNPIPFDYKDDKWWPV